MFFGVARVVFSVPGAKNGKRAVLQKLKERLSHRFHCAVADVEPNGPEGRAVLGLSIVSAQASGAEQEIEAILEFIRHNPDAAVIDESSDVLAFDDLAIMSEGTLADKEGLKRDWDTDPHESKKAAFLEDLRRARKDRE
jgi:uncharacterized protein YlxP (DUF503 family)